MVRLKCAILAILLVLMIGMCFGQDYITILDNWYFSNSGFSVPTFVDYLYLTPSDEPGTPAKGQFYYDSETDAFKICTNGTTFSALAAGTVGSLDSSYDTGSSIDVDGDPVTLTVGSSDDNAALQLTSTETSHDNDVLIIDYTGSGNAIYVDQGAADTQGMTLEPYASSTVASLEIDGNAHGWVGVDGVGMLHLKNDVELADTGSTLLLVDNTYQPLASSEGFLARFLDVSTARTTAYAVEIEVTLGTPALHVDGQVSIVSDTGDTGVMFDVTGTDSSTDTVQMTGAGSGDVLQLTSGATDTPALRVLSYADQTVSLAYFDGATSDWVGASDNVGMVQIVSDAQTAHVGGSLLIVSNSAQAVGSATGYLARFVSSGSAQTNANAVEIKVPATQPALSVNGITTIDGQDNAGDTLFQVAGIGASGNADAMSITNSGTGDCLMVTPTDTGSGGIYVTGKAAGTVPLLILDGDNDMNLADDKGQLLIQSDLAYNVAGATSLMVFHETGQPKSAAEGFLARFVTTGTAQTNATAVEIEVPATQPALAINGITKINGQDAAGATLFQVIGVGASGDADAVSISNTGDGDCLQITPGTTSAGSAINLVTMDEQTTPLLKFTTGTDGNNDPNWIGADDIGMIHGAVDKQLGHTGASLLHLSNNAQQASGAEGFLVRLVDTGTAQSDAYAMEIETTLTTPCLKLNNELVIAGASGSGTLLTVTHVGTSGNADGIVVTHNGSGDGFKLTCGDADSVGMNLVGSAAQTVSILKIDGTTGDWRGGSNVGMVNLTSDGPQASANASLLYIANTGVPTDNVLGSSLRIVDTGDASTGTGYAVYFSADDDNMEALRVGAGKVLVDEILTCKIGYQANVVTKISNTDGQTGSTIAKGTRICHVTGQNSDNNDWILLPAGTIGERLTIICDVQFELRTPAGSDDKINDVNSDGDTNEYLCTLGDIVDLICVETGVRWVAVSHDKLGAAKTVAPDS